MNVAFQSMKREHRKQKGHTSKSDIWGIDDQSIARDFSQTQLQYLKKQIFYSQNGKRYVSSSFKYIMI